MSSESSVRSDLTAPSQIAQDREKLDNKQMSAVESVTSYFDKIEATRDWNIFITQARERALEAAQASDKRIGTDDQKPLDGISIAVKDNFCTNGIRTTAGSRILQNFVPTYESTVTQKLRDAGAVLLGKVNMDEFAMGSSTETSYFGATVNPAGAALGLHNLVPGGSSGGSAAAVAGGLAAASVGTDTGGSIRQPASFCGVVGMKPTYGLCSRWGIMAFGSSLDQAGAFGKSVYDVASMMDVITGEDRKDTTSVPGKKLNYVQALSEPPRKLKIAIPKEVTEVQSTEDADRVWAEIHKIAGDIDGEIVEVSIPHFKYALPTYYILALCEASSNLARYDGVRYGYRAEQPKDIIDLYERSRAEGFGAEVKRRIMLGTFALSAGYYDAYYLKAQKVRQVVSDEFSRAFDKADVMVMPATPSSAFEIGSASDDPVAMYLEDVYTVAVNMAGLPGISLPVAKSANGMPLGMQIIGPHFGDEAVIHAAAQMEVTSRN